MDKQELLENAIREWKASTQEPLTPDGSITVTVKGTQKMGKRGGTRQREINVHFKGPDALRFINNPEYETLWEEYGVAWELFEDGEQAIQVSSVSIT